MLTLAGSATSFTHTMTVGSGSFCVRFAATCPWTQNPRMPGARRRWMRGRVVLKSERAERGRNSTWSWNDETSQ